MNLGMMPVAERHAVLRVELVVARDEGIVLRPALLVPEVPNPHRLGPFVVTLNVGSGAMWFGALSGDGSRDI